MAKIFIDPGHGGSDPGAIANGLTEKELTLAISLKIRDLLKSYENTQIKMSREDDSTVTLKGRTDLANNWGADYLVSVHINAGGGEGYEDYIYTSASQASKSYQDIMHEEILRQVDFLDRGKKQRNFHVIRASSMPAILTENGFIDHPKDAAKLKQTTFIDKIAQGHVNGLVKIFNLSSTKARPPIWDGMELKKGQIGRITVLRPINLWSDDENGKLQMVRILQPGERYRVYGFRSQYGGQYDVGAGHWVTNMDGYIKYETPSKTKLQQLADYYG